MKTQLNYYIGRLFTYSIIFITSVSMISACSNDKAANHQPIKKTNLLFDTVVTITLFDSQNEELLEGCFSLCETYEKLFSRTIVTSDISIINQNAGHFVTVSEDTIELLQYGILYGDKSEGRFDITIGSISRLWDFKSGNPTMPDANPTLPDAELLKQATSFVDYKTIQIQQEQVMVPEGASLDCGGIAKGFIADKLKQYLLENHVSSAIINLGGNIVAIGSKLNEEAFTIGIQKPFDTIGESITGIKVSNRSVVTSGIYERYFEKNDILYHHILNPETGYPCDTDLYSVTIISEFSVDGDGLSTTCLALGFEKGMELIENTPDTEGIFITQDNKLHYTTGIKDIVPLSDKDY